MSASSTLLSRRRYRSMMAVSKEIPLSLGTLRVTSPEAVVRFRLYGNAAVHVLTPQGQLLRSWGGPGQEPGHFNIPHSIYVDSLSRVWVADRDNDRVQIFDTQGQLLKVFSGLLYPGDVWSDQQYIYVSELEGRISIYTMDLVLAAEIGHRRSPHYGHSLTGDSQGNLYLGVFGEHSVVKYERLR